MYRVSDVLKPGFERSWHDVVALVQEVAAQMVPGSPVPSADDLLLDEDGVLQLGFGSDAPQNPVTALGSLLKSLLEGIDAPPGLRDLANDNAKEPPALSSVESFGRALAFYERPGRAGDLMAIAARLRGTSPVIDPQEEFERLREKVAAKAEARPTPEPEPVRKRKSRRKLLAVAAVELALLLAIVAYARPQYFRSATAFGDRLEQRLADTIAGGMNRTPTDPAPPVQEGLRAEAAIPSTRSAAAENSSSPSPRGGRGGPGASARVSRPPPNSPVEPPLPAAVEVPAPAGSAPGRSVEVRVLPVPDAVPVSRPNEAGVTTYSSADQDVRPPVIHRPQLPRQPEAGDDTGYFDLIVTETGTVERVQLLSPMRRFQERMLMSAAKAWTFSPAMRNGEPVRYRLRIAIILTDRS